MKSLHNYTKLCHIIPCLTTIDNKVPLISRFQKWLWRDFLNTCSLHVCVWIGSSTVTWQSWDAYLSIACWHLYRLSVSNPRLKSGFSFAVHSVFPALLGFSSLSFYVSVFFIFFMSASLNKLFWLLGFDLFCFVLNFSLNSFPIFIL